MATIDLRLGDCLELMRALPDASVDAVITENLQTITACDIMVAEVGNHDESTGGESAQARTSGDGLGQAQSGNRMALSQSGMESATDSALLWHLPGGDVQGNEAAINLSANAGELWSAERAIQRRNGKHAISSDDSQGQMLDLRGNGKASHSPQKRRASGQSLGELTSSLRFVPQPTDKKVVVAKKKVVVVTDPPYGCGKADWDDSFPTRWYREAKRVSNRVCIITGSFGVKDSLPLVGSDFLDIIAAWNLNALTRGNLGFSNWLACVVAGEKPRQGQNFFEFAVRGEMPNHPSPKPIEYMLKLIHRVTNEDDTVLDPFMGSGTTGVACVKLNRNFIGFEINADYFKIAQKRIVEAQMQMVMPL